MADDLEDSGILGGPTGGTSEAAPVPSEGAVGAPGLGSRIGGSLVNALTHTAGYATRDPALTAQADQRQQLQEKLNYLGPVADIKAQINQHISNRDYKSAFGLYQQNARLALMDPEFAKIGHFLATQMSTLSQRAGLGVLVDKMDEFTPSEKSTIKGQLTAGVSMNDALKTVHESRQGWEYSPVDAEGYSTRRNKYNGREERIKNPAAIKLTLGEEIGHIADGAFHPSATSMAKIELLPLERAGLSTLGIDEAQLLKDLRSPDLATRQQAIATRQKLFDAGQATDKKPGTDVETAKVAQLVGLPVLPYLEGYAKIPGAMEKIVAAQQQLKTNLIVKEAYARAGADDVIQHNKGWQEAYGGRYSKEALFDTMTGKQVTSNERFGDVMNGLGKNRALLQPNDAAMVRFAKRGELVVDQLADLMPKVLAANKGNPGVSFLRGLQIAVEKKVLPSEVLGQWQSLQAMAGFDANAVESRSSRPMAMMLKQIKETQVPTDSDSIQSGAGKLKVLKSGLMNVPRAAFGQDLITANDVQLGSAEKVPGVPTGIAPSGRTVPLLNP